MITKEGTQYLRPYDVANEKGVRQGKYTYKRGATGELHKWQSLYKWQISFCKVLKMKQYHGKVLPSSFHLNSDTPGFNSDLKVKTTMYIAPSRHPLNWGAVGKTARKKLVPPN